MSHLLDDDDDTPHGHGHREFTLSTGTVLGIFLGLALSWALFFGFGYNMGSKARQAAQAPIADGSAEPGNATNFNNFKPAAGSPAGSSPATPAPTSTYSPSISVPPQTGGTAPTSTAPAPASTATAATTTPPDATATPEKPAPITIKPVSPAPGPAPVSTGSFVVQVAAVSHKEDAGYLVSALKAKGYAVTAQPQADNLVHVQVGPFNNRKEADSMRQQLLSDGYNAIVK